jgi:hypothetical protein
MTTDGYGSRGWSLGVVVAVTLVFPLVQSSCGKWLNDLRRRDGGHQPFAGVWDYVNPRKQEQ